MKPFTLLLLSVMSIASLTNCKKNKNTAVKKIDTPFVYGYMTTTRHAEQTIIGDTFAHYEDAQAYFIGDSIAKALVIVNPIIMDGDTLTYPSLPAHVVAFANLPVSTFAGGVNWSIQGTGTIPAISFNSPGSFPNYTGTTPDTILVANGLTIQFNSGNLTNVDSIGIGIESSFTNDSYASQFSAAHGDCVITSAQLSAAFTAQDKMYGNPMVLSMSVWKNDYLTVNGKLFKFTRQYWISHRVYVL